MASSFAELSAKLRPKTSQSQNYLFSATEVTIRQVRDAQSTGVLNLTAATSTLSTSSEPPAEAIGDLGIAKRDLIWSPVATSLIDQPETVLALNCNMFRPYPSPTTTSDKEHQ